MAPDLQGPMAAINDAELMRRVQSSDEAAFAVLMQRWERPVKAVVARLVFNQSEAEDLAQETFVRVWQHRARFAAGRPVKPWILGIAINLARNRLRWWKRRPAVELEDWTQVPEDDGVVTRRGASGLEQVERANQVRDAIAALPAPLREAIVLFEYEQMSYAEIAEAVSATSKAVENRIARARAKLRVALLPLV
jgi:RNA polymerase sigma factor (sigma-70 family)